MAAQAGKGSRRRGWQVVRGCLLGILLVLTGCATSTARPAATDQSSANPLLRDTIGLDHVLVWSQDHAAGEAYLRDRLGFRLTERPGNYGAGIANKLIWFRNLSFIEFLWLESPELTRTEAPDEHAFVTLRNGSNAFGVQVTDVDATYAALRQAALRPQQPSSETYDFDGPEGPRPPEPSRWRFMFLEPGSMPGNPFFVDYNLPPDASVPRSDQPNGARRMSSVWILVRDVGAATATYGRAGFRARGRVSVPDVGSGVALNAGEGEILLISPTDELHRSRLSRYGEHVVGFSIEVDNLAATRQLLQGRLELSLPQSRSVYGPSVRVPSLGPLGVHVEFHG